jgi:Fur family ferric uptake transcriptional regulator
MPNRKDDFHKHGLKVTSPRLKILALFETHPKKHFTADEIFHELQTQGEEIGVATVYRVLTQFHEAGLLTRHQFETDRYTFELDTGEHHDHLVCVQCHRLIEFVDPLLEARQQSIAKQHQFHMTDHRLHIFGVCQPCFQKNNS